MQKEVWNLEPKLNRKFLLCYIKVLFPNVSLNVSTI